LPSINADRRQGAARATAHLLSLGCDPVALFAADFPGGGPHGARPELAGFRDAHAGAGRTPDESLVRFASAPGPVQAVAGASLGPAPAVAGALLEALRRTAQERGTRPGLVLFSYTLAPEVCRVIAGAPGLAVPEELGLVLCDADTGLSEALDVPLTTVQAPKFEMATAAVDLLLDRLRGAGNGTPVARRSFPMGLNVGWSCGARPRRRGARPKNQLHREVDIEPTAAP
jgi:DNA-binding LacI/PurR family transcriptional regulator